MRAKSLAVGVVGLLVVLVAAIFFGQAWIGGANPSTAPGLTVAERPPTDRTGIEPWLILDDDGRQHRVDNGVIFEVSPTAVTLRDLGPPDSVLRPIVRIERSASGAAGNVSQVPEDLRIASRFDQRFVVVSKSGELLLKQSDGDVGAGLGIRQSGGRLPSGQFLAPNHLELRGDLQLADGTAAKIAVVDVAQRLVLWSSAEFRRSWPNPVSPQRVMVTGPFVRDGPQRLGVLDLRVPGSATFSEIAGGIVAGARIGFTPGEVQVSVVPRVVSTSQVLYDEVRLGDTRLEFPNPPADWSSLNVPVNRLIGPVLVYLAESSDVVLWNLETSKVRSVRLLGRHSSARLFAAIDDKSQLWVTDGRSVWFVGSVQ